jgi:hypothetical protein
MLYIFHAAVKYTQIHYQLVAQCFYIYYTQLCTINIKNIVQLYIVSTVHFIVYV